MSRDDIVSSGPIFIPGKEYLDSPEKGLLELRRIYRSDDNISSSDLTRISIMAACFGDPEFALDAMEKGVSINGNLLSLSWCPVFREVRRLPRFKELMREIGLVDYWKEFGWPDICRPVGVDDFVCD